MQGPDGWLRRAETLSASDHITGCVFGKETKEDQPWEFLGEVKCPVFL